MMNDDWVARLVRIAAVSVISKCPHAIFDQFGNPVCMKNPEAPGDCKLPECPYGYEFYLEEG